jgi:chromosome segregation ATPase
MKRKPFTARNGDTLEDLEARMTNARGRLENVNHSLREANKKLAPILESHERIVGELENLRCRMNVVREERRTAEIRKLIRR